MTIPYTTINKWKPIISIPIESRIRDIVDEIAMKLSDPQKVVRDSKDIITNLRSENKVAFRNWDNMELFSGITGIIMLYGELDKLFPNDGWDLIGNKYMLLIQQLINERPLSVGEWIGIGISARSLSRNGSRYSKLIKKLNDHFLNIYLSNLDNIESNVMNNLSPAAFDVISGLTGLGRYLLIIIEDEKADQLLKRVLSIFIKLTKDKIFESRNVPGWYISYDNQFEREKARFPKGSLDIGLAHGISGPLALLSLTMLKGIEIPGQQKAIERITEILVDMKGSDKYGPVWPSILNVEDLLNGTMNRDVENHESWCYGIPGIARSLWLAAKATNSKHLQDVALDSFRGVCRRPIEEWNINSMSICHGYAGLLQITQRMYSESGIEELDRQRTKILEVLLTNYDPLAPFSFYDYEFDIKHHALPYFLEGSTGIALTLLSLINTESPEWDAPLLII